MKRVLLTLLAIVFVGCAGPQKTANISDSSAQTSANTIIVHTNMDSQSAFKKVGQTLLNRGYTFRHLSKTFKSLSTEFTGIPANGTDIPYVRLGIYIKDNVKSKVIIRGWYTVSGNKDTQFGDRIMKFGLNGSKRRTAWSEMFQVAESIGDSLSYRVE